MFELKLAIIHSFKKLAHTEFVSEVVIKDELLDVENPALKFLAHGINGLIGKEGNSVVYGQFASDGREGPFPNSFSDYSQNVVIQKDFVALTHLAMEQLVDQAGKQVLSTGGHILCALYNSNGSDFFLVASMKERGGIQLDENYVPKAIQEVDLSKVQQAARINFESFRLVVEAEAREVEGGLGFVSEQDEVVDEECPELDSTYLCFISKGRDSQASDYFITALGCAKGVASGRATKNAIEFVTKFFRNKPALKGLVYKARESVINYLETQFEDKKPARLDAICHVATTHVPPELIEDIAGLKDYLNNERNRVPDEFTVNGKSLKEKTRIKGIANTWSLQFERGALGQDPVADVFYDEGRKKLTLSNLSSELIGIIEKELKARTA